MRMKMLILRDQTPFVRPPFDLSSLGMKTSTCPLSNKKKYTKRKKKNIIKLSPVKKKRKQKLNKNNKVKRLSKKIYHKKTKKSHKTSVSKKKSKKTFVSDPSSIFDEELTPTSSPI